MRARRAEARRSSDRGICSRSPVVDERRVRYGKSNCRRLHFGDFCRSFLPERTPQPRCDLRPDMFPYQNHVAGDHGTAFCFAAQHPAHGSPCGESPFRQKGSTEIASCKLNLNSTYLQDRSGLEFSGGVFSEWDDHPLIGFTDRRLVVYQLQQQIRGAFRRSDGRRVTGELAQPGFAG